MQSEIWIPMEKTPSGVPTLVWDREWGGIGVYTSRDDWPKYERRHLGTGAQCCVPPPFHSGVDDWPDQYYELAKHRWQSIETAPEGQIVILYVSGPRWGWCTAGVYTEGCWRDPYAYAPIREGTPIQWHPGPPGIGALFAERQAAFELPSRGFGPQ